MCDANEPEVAPDDRLLLTPEDAARRLSIGRTTLFELVSSGRLEAVRVGRSRRIRTSALRRFVDELPTLEEECAVWADPNRYRLGVQSNRPPCTTAPIDAPQRDRRCLPDLSS